MRELLKAISDYALPFVGLCVIAYALVYMVVMLVACAIDEHYKHKK